MGFELGLGSIFYRYFSIGGDIGIDYFEDEKEFTQMTTGGERESTIIVPYASLLAGLKTPLILFSENSKGRFGFGINAGRTWVFNARRTIDNCADCYEEELDIDAGYFIEPETAIYYDMGMKLGIGLAYRHFFLESDYERRFILKFIIISN